MRIQSKPIFFFSGFLILLLVFSHSKSLRAQEIENEREFDYSEGGEKGPKHWGDIKEEWAACKNGSMQSPIDMSNERVEVILKSTELQKSYRPWNCTVKNRGHDISVQWWNYSAGRIGMNGTVYFLEQAHWHSPSEHTINGRRYDLELHMVHKSLDPNVKNKITVIGLLYRMGPPDPFLSKLIENITSMADQLEERNMGMIDPKEIRMEGNRYYRYMGSLTVPPCTEGVIWTINKKIGTVSQDQIKALRVAVHDYAEMNARPLQPINQRGIQLYGPNTIDMPN
ncbi:Alpha carbonic anhydrase [Melia azedarach]|uniref:Alpha carbonic anhydrase n=1 Tax=Melia azedarach TaxID=155640 RepID=A0ACC1X271_MELAZ|nr:Alpha carbonic anhydrase [Melia azedarach]